MLVKKAKTPQREIGGYYEILIFPYLAPFQSFIMWFRRKKG